MKVASITRTQEKIALKTPFVTALREVSDVVFVRVKILCDNGFFAYGEAPATKAVTGETLLSIAKDIDSIKDRLSGLGLREALEVLHETTIGSSAKAAVDMALLFLMAQEQGESLRDFFHIRDTSPIQTDITISLGTQQKMLDDAKKALREHKNILKIKLGAEIAHAVAVTRELSRSLPEATLLIDANQAWSKEDTLLYLRETKEIQIALIEQPVAAADILSLAAITAKSSVPVLADEAVFTLDDVKNVLRHKAADMINIKLMKCGGLSKAIEILEYAREQKIGCMLGSMLEGPISINAALYLAFAYRDVVHYVDLDSPLLYKELPCEMDFTYRGSSIWFNSAEVLQ